MSDLLSVTDARARILDHFQPMPTERIDLAQARLRVMAEDLIANENIPPFANSSMDGYAVRVSDTASATRETPVTLPVVGDIPAGAALPTPLHAGSAMRIMTGAPVPPEAEAIVPVEDTNDARRSAGPPPATITVFVAPQLNAFIRPVGQDMRVGERVLAAGAVLRPAALGALAALGQAQVLVHQPPLVAVLSTGDELVPVAETPRPGQIRDVNGTTIAAAVAQCGARVLPLGIAHDTEAEVRAKLLEAVERGAQLILSSAGVSVGAYDVVKTVVEAEGALNFWRVKMRPGKPLAFGEVRGVPFFGLPGNPVSALVTFEVFVRPGLLKLCGQRVWVRPEVPVALAAPLRSDGRESYLRAILEVNQGHYQARLTGDQSSNMITSLVKANGLVIVPAEVREVAAGEVLRAWWLEA